MKRKTILTLFCSFALCFYCSLALSLEKTNFNVGDLSFDIMQGNDGLRFGYNYKIKGYEIIFYRVSLLKTGKALVKIPLYIQDLNVSYRKEKLFYDFFVDTDFFDQLNLEVIYYNGVSFEPQLFNKTIDLIADKSSLDPLPK